MQRSPGHGRLTAMNGERRPSDAGTTLGPDRVLGGRYRLISPVGAGGTAVVWQAYDNVLARTVAVKVLAAHCADDAQSRERIRREARAAAALSHPNIAQVYDYGEADVGGDLVPYVVMELIRGDTLHKRINDGPVLPRYAMRVCAEIAAALSAAHTEGLAHRDIKPANVMLAPTGAKVVDFGIAAAIQPTGSSAGDFEVFGTPAYLAPERLLHDAVEPASDVYALGVLLYRLLAGHSPWTIETTTQMLTAHIYLEPAPLLPMFQVPQYVTDLGNRCLAKDPTQRPSAREAAALLAHGAGIQVITDEHQDQAPVDADPAVFLPTSDPVTDGRPPAPAQGVELAAAEPSKPPVAASAALAREEPAAADDASPTGPARKRARYSLVAVVLLVAIAAAVWFLHPTDRDAQATGPAPGFSSAPSASPAVKAPGATPTATAPGGSKPSPTGLTATNTRRPGTTAPAAAAATPKTEPATVATEPTATTTPPAAPPEERTLSSAAGTVRATCPSPGTAQILSWSATKPYKVVEGDDAAGPSPSVSFKHGNTRVTMTVTCDDGVPSSTTS